MGDTSVTLNSGHRMAAAVVATASSPTTSPDSFCQTIVDAIAAGYRLFETSSLYHCEQPLGIAIEEALRLGLIHSRAELFITTKLRLTDAHRCRVVPALRESLRNLNLDYVDLFLVHWPLSLSSDCPKFPFKKRLWHIDLKSVWKEMEECSKLGLTKSIGVSNFSYKKLEELLETAMIPPTINQVEMNPWWQHKKLIDFCKEKGIVVATCSPNVCGFPWVKEMVVLCRGLDIDLNKLPTEVSKEDELIEKEITPIPEESTEAIDILKILVPSVRMIYDY